MDAVRIRLDPSARAPLSEQLRSALAARIASGRLAPGERMPTVRDLAAELEIAPNTVAKAYRDLASAGSIVGRGRRGTFVSERLPLGFGDEMRASPRPRKPTSAGFASWVSVPTQRWLPWPRRSNGADPPIDGPFHRE